MIDRLVNMIANLPGYSRAFGWSGLLGFARIRYASDKSPMPLSLRGNNHPIWLRPKSTDVMTMKEIFLACDYDFAIHRPVKVIVDAGANIGLATVYFARAYPEAHIIAIEPERKNFLLLQKNTRAYPRVTAMHAALWGASGQIRVVDPGRGEHGFITQEPGHFEIGGELVPAVSVDALLAMHGLDRIDLLKMDIEGAEKEVFETAAGWIDRVDTVVVELNDRFKPGCGEAFELATMKMTETKRKGKLVMKGRSAHAA